jgi:hypothetical protein
MGSKRDWVEEHGGKISLFGIGVGALAGVMERVFSQIPDVVFAIVFAIGLLLILVPLMLLSPWMRQTEPSLAAEILDVKLLLHPSRQGMFDLLVPVLVHDGAPFRNNWQLTLRLVDGRVVEGMRGGTKPHAFNPPQGRYDMTVSFPFGAQIPELKSLAGAAVMRLSAVNSKDRMSVFEPVQGLPLLPWQDEEPYPVGPIISVEIRKEARNDIPHHAAYVPYLWGLAVRNDGDAAEFQASIKLLSGATTHLPEGRAHRLSFREGLKQRLAMGAEDYVFFALVIWNGLYGGVIAKGLWYYDETAKHDDSAVLLSTDGKKPSDSVIDVEVTIVSDPSMPLPWRRRYRLGPDNELHDVTRSGQSTEVLPPKESNDIG